LCYWKVTRNYGLTKEEVKSQIENPDTRTPSHHQVDPRIIKAHLTGESVPTFLPKEDQPDCFGLPTYLPKDRFSPSDLVVPLVNNQYR
jgi:protein-disulfide isomerase-like protein with CxxC motif